MDQSPQQRPTSTKITLPVITCFLLLLQPVFPLPEAEAAPTTTDPAYASVGYWDGMVRWHNDATGIHLVLMRGPTGKHSQLLYFYGGGPDTFRPARTWSFNANEDVPALYIADNDPILPQPMQVKNVPVDINLFCGGHVGLPDGRVLFTGGTELGAGEGAGISGVRIFDPLSQSWAAGASMVHPRWYPTNTVLPDGKVLVTSGRKYRELLAWGGADMTTPAPNVRNDFSAYCGVRADLKFLTPIVVSGTPPAARCGHSSVFDPVNLDGDTRTGWKRDQRMVIFGGLGADGQARADLKGLTRSIQGKQSWVDIVPTGGGNVPSARYGHAYCFAGNLINKMFIFGGRNTATPTPSYFKDLYALNLKTSAAGSDFWESTALPSLPASYQGLEGARLVYWYDRFDSGTNKGELRPEHYLYLFGGLDETGVAHSEVWRLQIKPFVGSWEQVTPAGAAPAARGYATVAARETDRVFGMYLLGGESSSTVHNTNLYFLEVPDPTATPTWRLCTRQSGSKTPKPRTRAAGVFDKEFDNRLIVSGGSFSAGTFQASSDSIWRAVVDASDPTDLKVKWTADPGLLSGPRSGHTAVYDPRWIDVEVPEVYDPIAGAWQAYTDSTSWLFTQLYPNLLMMPDGKPYMCNEHTTFLFGLPSSTPTWSQPAFSESHFHAGSVVQYRPGKVLKAGEESGTGSRKSEWLDYNAGSPTWTYSETGLPAHRRVKHNLTLLPNGKVMLTGGMQVAFKPLSATRSSAIWNPELTADNKWEPDTLAQDPAVRDYHSSALLLSDGRILTAGGWDGDNRTATIFWPPYLFDGTGALATRPIVTCITHTTLGYGNKIVIRTSDAANLLPTKNSSASGRSGVVLLKPGAVTHQFNQDQRYVPLSYQILDSERIVVDTPASGHEAPPGDYLLFLVKGDARETPSVATWVRVDPNATNIPSGATFVGGTLSANATWSGDVFVYDDVSVPVAKTLTIQPGTKVHVVDAQYLRVDGGVLTATGATFSAGESCPWGGIVAGTGTATLTACVVRDALVGLAYGILGDATGSGSATGCTFENNTTIGIYVNSKSASAMTLDRNTISCPAVANVVGIQVGLSNVSPPWVYRSRIYGPGSTVFGAKGIYCLSSANLFGNRVKDFSGTSGRGIEFALSDSNAVPVIDQYIGSPADTAFISNCKDGIYVTNFSRPKIRKTRIDNTTYAIRVTSAACADVGKYGDYGYCDISNSSTKLVHAATRLPGFPNIDALYNYWGTTTYSTIAAKMTSNVNWDPFLTDDPLPTLNADRWGLVAVLDENRPMIFGNAPNPFRRGTAISYNVPRDGLVVAVKVFNVRGELISSHLNLGTAQGRQEWVWDGKDRSGREVPAGAYFFSVQIGKEFLGTRRMVRVR